MRAREALLLGPMMGSVLAVGRVRPHARKACVMVEGMVLTSMVVVMKLVWCIVRGFAGLAVVVRFDGGVVLEFHN